jgi:hypothetical protein
VHRQPSKPGGDRHSSHTRRCGNSRVLEARKVPVDGPPIVIRTFDVDEIVENWSKR